MVFWAVVFIALFLIIAGCKKSGVSSETQTSAQASTGNVVQNVKSGCEDSDGGIIAEKAGKASGAANGQEFVYYDNCPVIRGEFLMEYYCEDGESKSQNVRCPTGTRCLGGACRKI